MSGNAALGRGVLGAYGAPSFAQAFIHGPAISVLQGIYAKFFGLSLQEIAFVILLSRIFDAVNDPIVGFLSDRYRARHGTRKPGSWPAPSSPSSPAGSSTCPAAR